jgi:peptidyl-prolyl cis-trans isomerase A (cyclophilin A)
MKTVLMTLFAGLVLAGSAAAQIYADFQTSLGAFSCELFHTATPRTVGNFVTLAEGSRAWLDEDSGIVSGVKPPQPFYNGLTFHRVVNRPPSFAIAQGGSRTGGSFDGPGYSFPDEMSEAVPASYKFDQPYLLAMANSGPNTNGSQFFLTGTAMPSLDGLYTVFGRVSSGMAVVDAILGVEIDASEKPITPVVIQNVVIRRVGKEAAKFKATKQPLPKVAAAKFKTVSLTDGNHRLIFPQKARSVSRIWTDTPANPGWDLVFERYLGSGEPTYKGGDVPLGGRTLPLPSPASWLRPSVVTYGADALAPTRMNGWQLALGNEAADFVFTFPVTGSPTYVYTEEGSTTPQNGTITSVSYEPDGYGATLVIETSGLYPLRLRLGFDAFDGTVLSGRQSGSYLFLFRWVTLNDGTDFTMTRLP